MSALRTMRVTIDAERVSPSKALAAAARAAPLLVVTGRAFADLAAELGSDEAAYRFLMRISERVNRPLGVNFPTADGSRTCFLAPKGWTQERLKGWVGGKRDEIEDAFGPATPVPLEDL